MWDSFYQVLKARIRVTVLQILQVNFLKYQSLLLGAADSAKSHADLKIESGCSLKASFHKTHHCHSKCFGK